MYIDIVICYLHLVFCYIGLCLCKFHIFIVHTYTTIATLEFVSRFDIASPLFSYWIHHCRIQLAFTKIYQQMNHILFNLLINTITRFSFLIKVPWNRECNDRNPDDWLPNAVEKRNHKPFSYMNNIHWIEMYHILCKMFVIKTHRKLVLIVFLFRTIISLVNMYRLSTSFITTS